jgi:hypothetical protein
MSDSLSKKQATCGKTTNNYIPQTNEHLHKAGHRYKQENSNLIWKRGVSDHYSYNLAGAQFIFSEI